MGYRAGVDRHERAQPAVGCAEAERSGADGLHATRM
jgi:hypothetical protein